MSDGWSVAAVVAIVCAYRLAVKWLEQRSHDAGPQHADTEALVETNYQDHVRDDGERCLPPVRLGFQREDTHP